MTDNLADSTGTPRDATKPVPHDSSTTPELPGVEAAAVPPGIRVASDWAWRLLLIGAAIYLLSLAVRSVSEIVVPVAIAILMTALLRPVATSLHRFMKPGAAAGLTLLGTILVIGALFTLVGTQFSSGFSDLTGQVATGLERIRDWVRTTFHITDAQFDQYFNTIRDKVSQSGNLSDTATSVGLTATHFVAGLFIALFSLFFFLYEGPRIWSWIVRLFPRATRPRVDSSGVIAWQQLSAFVRATMIVAFVDAVGISVGAAILKVPFAFAIGVLVFILAFIPIVGALLSGAVAVLLALVAHGPASPSSCLPSSSACSSSSRTSSSRSCSARRSASTRSRSSSPSRRARSSPASSAHSWRSPLLPSSTRSASTSSATSRRSSWTVR